jgi:hypothetical protein
MDQLQERTPDVDSARECVAQSVKVAHLHIELLKTIDATRESALDRVEGLLRELARYAAGYPAEA